MLQLFINHPTRERALVFLCLLLSFFNSYNSKAQFPFVQRETWDGPYDIKMIAAPNLDPVYLNATEATSGKLLADSLITYNTMLMTGDLFEINNRYKGGSPFNQTSIPLQAILCDDPMAGCGTLGLPLNTPNSSCPERFNNPETVSSYISMTYADYDNDMSTFSSSMSELDISACSEIEAAYLYWTGMFKGSNEDIMLLDGPLNSYNGGSDVFNTSASSGFDRVKFKIPGGNYQIVTSDQTRDGGDRYLCVTDVTNLVQGTGGGQFWVGDLQSYPNEGGGGSTSGWVLVVIFRSPLSPPRLISLWDGLESISSGDSEVFNLTGLEAPATNNFKSYVGFGALDGENIASQLDGDIPEGLGFKTNSGGNYVEINPFALDQPNYKLWTKKGYPANCGGSDNIDGCKAPLFDANWCSVYDGISSSHITSYDEFSDKNGNEIVRLPSNKNTLGFDAHHLKLPDGAVAPGATEATLTVQAGPQGGTTPFFAYIAIERLQPKLELTKTADKSSTELNTQITYNLRIKNIGNAPSLGGDIIYDTLDEATDFVTGSLSSIGYVNGVTNNSPGVTIVSTAGDNLEFQLSNPILPKDSIDISFTVQVIDYTTNINLWDVQCKRTITNTAWIDYNTISSGILRSKSNANDCGIGSETSILIFDAQIGGSTTTQLGPFDGCIIATDSIRKRVEAELLSAGIPSTQLTEFDIRDSNFVRVRTEHVFGTINGTVKYFAIRDLSSSGNCQEIYELLFECDPCTNPTITSPPTETVCSGEALNYNITSDDPLATFTWDRALLAGISNPAASGQVTDSITETLINTGSSAVVVRYIITATVNGCSGIPFNLDVTVNPLPEINSDPTETICSGSPLHYEITSNIGTATFSWERAATVGISNTVAINQSTNPIEEVLNNTSSDPVVTRYIITPTANTCIGDPFNLDVTVNPIPEVTSLPTGTICSEEPQNYNITSNINGSTYSWKRASVTGISNSAIVNQTSNPITEALTNTTSNPLIVRYIITPTANNCTGPAFNYDVTVNPLPEVNSAPTETICSGDALNYTISSNISSATFNWERAAIPNISNAAVSAQTANPITEALNNTGNGSVNVNYIITPSAIGCIGSPFNLEVTVNQAPSITSAATESVCSGEPLNYEITSNEPTATFTWDRASITGISNPTAMAQNTNPITENLENTESNDQVATYTITPTANGCIGDPFELEVTVGPIPTVTSSANESICSGTSLNYDITSNINSATFLWNRPVVSNISNTAVSSQSTDPITETLTNTGTASEIVTYSIIPEANGCIGDAFIFEVTVNPAPMITSDNTKTVCSGEALNYDITSNVSGTTFTWERTMVNDITNPTVIGQTSDPITESLENTGPNPVEVIYLIAPSSTGCPGIPFQLEVTVNPAPSITSASTDAVCSGVALNYDIVSNVSSATFTWNRAAVANISNNAVNGQNADPIIETLINTGINQEIVHYSITPAAYGCTGIPFQLEVTVSPTPEITSSATEALCSNSPLSYDITSNITGSNFIWERQIVPEISNNPVAFQTTDPITETLINSGNSPVIASYIITPSANGCTGNPFSLNVTVNPVPVITSASSENICSGASLTYNITSNISSASFTWDRASVTDISNPAVTGGTANPIHEILNNTGVSIQTVNYIITPVAFGCTGNPFNLDIAVKPIPEVSSQPTGTVCSDTPLNYNINSSDPSTSFTWSRTSVTNISNPAVSFQTTDPISETLINTGSIPVVVKYDITPSLNGCSGPVFTYNVTVNPPTKIISQPSNAVLCENDPLKLQVLASGTSPLTYQWQYNGNDIPGETNASLALNSIIPSQAGSYAVIVTGACGIETSDPSVVEVTANPQNNLEVSGSETCMGEEGSISIINSQPGVNYQAFKGTLPIGNPIPGNGDKITFTIPPSLLSPGSNTISIHAYGCSNTLLENTGTIEVTPIPQADAGGNMVVDDFIPVTLDGSGSTATGVGYEWTAYDQIATIYEPDAVSTTAEITEAITHFTLKVYDLNNTRCQASDEKIVRLIPKPVKIPNAFSPNEDGVHDYFEIQNIKFFRNSILYVYNQWGELIYQSEPGYIIPWDGKRNGKPVPVSAYYYVLELNENGFNSLAGDITVIR